MTTTQTTERWAELQELDDKVRAARERAEHLRAEAGKAARAVERATAPLRDYYEQLGAGEREPDAALERELQAAVKEAEESVTLRPRYGRGGEFLQVEVVDQRHEAELAGAERALLEARQAVDTFLSRRRDDLMAELLPYTFEARDGFDRAWQEVRDAERIWLALLQRWARVAEVIGITPDEMPAHPLRGLDPAIDRGAPLPMPAALIPAEDEEEEEAEEAE